MATSIEDFKRAFAYRGSDDRLKLDKQTEAALLGLKELTLSLDQRAPTTQGHTQTLTGLVTRYAGTKKQNGLPYRALEELQQIYGETLGQITQLRGLSGTAGAPSPTAFVPTSNGSPAPPPVVGGTAVKADASNGAPPPVAGGGSTPGNAPPPVAKDAPAKPGAYSSYLMDGLDADDAREINVKTDARFYEKFSETYKIPKGQKIPPNSEAAAKWLELRDGVMAELAAPPKPLDKAKRAELGDQQRDKHMDQIEKTLVEVLKLKDEQITELLVYAQDNAIPDKDGTKLLEALSGKSKLGKLSVDAQKGLIQLYALHWLYSPGRENQEGAADNIAKLTEALKDADPKTKAMVARMFLVVINSVPNKVLIGANEDVVEEQLNIQRAMRNASIDLDPTGYVQAVKYGDQLAMSVLGNTKRHYYQGDAGSGTGTQTRSEDVSLTEERRNALILAVARGALSKEDTDKFFDMMFNWSSDYDVSPRDSLFGHLFDVDPTSVPQQEAMAKLLGKIVNKNHAKNEKDAQFNDANLMEIMKSKGGREILFSTSMPDEYRLWALDMMSANSSVPGKKPWTAKDLAQGWESPVVVQAFAGSALKQARASFAQPWKMDATKDRGTLTNAIGQLLGQKPDKLPKKDETEDEKKKREAEKSNHPLYDQDKKPFKKILEHIGPGNAIVTGIPVTVMNRQEGAALFQVLRVQKDETSPAFFIDHDGNKYDAVGTWKEKNEYPPGAMTYPKDLILGNPLETARTPKDSKKERVLDAADKAAMAVGMVAGAALLVGTGGLATPLVAGAAAAYSGVRAVQKLADMHDRGYDVTDLGDGDVRGVYIDIASNAFGVGAMGSARLIGAMTKEGAKISRAGANLIAGLTWAGNLTDAASIAHQIDKLAIEWKNMDEGQKASALMSLGFAGAMKGKQLKQGGFRGQFDYTRIRNQLEYGTPFSLQVAKEGELQGGQKIAVRHDGKGKMTIIHAADYDPLKNRDMLALHSDAAVAMEASYTLKEKLKRMIGKADPEKLPPGSAAWEAHHELLKIDAELQLNQNKMWNADEKTRKALIARQIELNEAIVKQNARLDHWDKDGSGVVAAPAKGADQAKALGWDKAKVPEGYHWVAGDSEPHLFAPGNKQKLYYSPRKKTFIPEKERAELEQISDRVERSFDRAFDTKLDPNAKPLGPDDLKRRPGVGLETIDAKKGGMPDVHRDGMWKAEQAEELAAALSLSTDQLKALTGVTGNRVSKDFIEAWTRAAAKSKPATEALDKIRLLEKKAAEAEAKKQPGKAQKLRNQASKLAKEAYDPVRDEFWKEIYNDKMLGPDGNPVKKLGPDGKPVMKTGPDGKPTKEFEYEDGPMLAQLKAAGLTIEEGKAPYLRVPDPRKGGKFIELQITLEHFDRKTDAPLKAQDANNLMFSFRYENTVLLEHIRRIVRKKMGVNKGQPHPMN